MNDCKRAKGHKGPHTCFQHASDHMTSTNENEKHVKKTSQNSQVMMTLMLVMLMFTSSLIYCPSFSLLVT